MNGDVVIVDGIVIPSTDPPSSRVTVGMRRDESFRPRAPLVCEGCVAIPACFGRGDAAWALVTTQYYLSSV